MCAIIFLIFSPILFCRGTSRNVQKGTQHLPIHGHERQNGGPNMGAVAVYFIANHPINPK